VYLVEEDDGWALEEEEEEEEEEEGWGMSATVHATIFSCRSKQPEAISPAATDCSNESADMSGNKSAGKESLSHNRRSNMSGNKSPGKELLSHNRRGGNKSAGNESAVAATDCSNESAGHVKAVATEVTEKGGVGGKQSRRPQVSELKNSEQGERQGRMISAQGGRQRRTESNEGGVPTKLRPKIEKRRDSGSRPKRQRRTEANEGGARQAINQASRGVAPCRAERSPSVPNPVRARSVLERVQLLLEGLARGSCARRRRSHRSHCRRTSGSRPKAQREGTGEAKRAWK